MPEIGPAYRYEASVLEVIHGDTFHLEVDMGFYTRRRIQLRLRRVNTPEIYGVSADSDVYQHRVAAKRAAEGFIENSDQLLVTTVHPIDVDEIDLQGKSGRRLADLIESASGDRVSERLREMDGVEVYT